MTTPLMTAADMRTFLIEKRRDLDAQRAVIAAEQAAQEAERLKVWAPMQLAKMQAIVALALSLGYEAAVEMDDREDDVFYAVVKVPDIEAEGRPIGVMKR